ncbi:MAG: histidine triad nucleotide-binding protein [Mycobacteriales bacterium]|nr:MAG: histidine triad nucleotide-binding protein [Pseudonocardiales bacterium]
MADCLFCSIVAGDIPSTEVWSDDRCYAFRDVNPKAPVHVLVVPRSHHLNLAELATGDADLTVALMRGIAAVADAEGLAGSGYRVVFNTGRDGQQTVNHVHAHVMGNRAMRWPPG